MSEKPNDGARAIIFKRNDGSHRTRDPTPGKETNKEQVTALMHESGCRGGYAQWEEQWRRRVMEIEEEGVDEDLQT